MEYKEYKDLTRDQIKEELAKLKTKKLELKDTVDFNNAMQLALKLVLNGTYGAFGAKFFVCFNIHIAAAITAMGREVTKHMVERIEHYFYNLWHNDVETHQKMGINSPVQPIPSPYWDYKLKKEISVEEYDTMSRKQKEEEWNKTLRYMRKNPVAVYGDTDSVFVGFMPALKSCNWQGDEKQFVLSLFENKLEGWFDRELTKWTNSYGVENLHGFALERINASTIWLGKKRYIQNAIWEDGIDYDELSYIFPKGVELIKSSTPLFAREKLMDVVKYLLANPKTYSQKRVHGMLKDLKEQFMLADPEDIAMTTSCSNYQQNVIDDETSMTFAPKCYWTIKAAAYHNFLLHQNPELKKKYDLIKSERIKYYYTTNRDPDKVRFAFLRGAFPEEIAPEIDYDTQFEKSILSILNSIGEAIGFKPFDRKLSYKLSLFSFAD